MNTPPIYLLRHGETEWNREDRRQGRLGSDLTDKGVEQARAMGETLLRRLGVNVPNWQLVCSPQQRAVHSATLVGEVLGLGLSTDDRLMEVAMGSWEGLTWPEIEARWPGVAGDHDIAHFRIPDGEPYADVAARAQAWLESVTTPTIALSHGVFGRVLRTVYLEQDQGGYAKLQAGGQASFYLLQDGGISEVKV